MTLIERVKNICLMPKTEWEAIAEEPTTPASLLTGYVAPLAAIGAVAGFIGSSIIGYSVYVGTYRIAMGTGLLSALFAFAMAILGVVILSVMINVFAPTFDAQKNWDQALKLAVYSYTPLWVAGALQILPWLNMLALFAVLYGVYLMYLGLPRLMKCSSEKTVSYTAVVVVCAIVLHMVVGTLAAAAIGIGRVSSGAFANLAVAGRADTNRTDLAK